MGHEDRGEGREVAAAGNLVREGSASRTTYDVRPMACRGHYVLAEDSNVCANRAVEPVVETVEFPLAVAQAVMPMLGEGYVAARGALASRAREDAGWRMMMISTTQKFWALSSVFVENGPDVREVECFVAPNGKVLPVPGADSNYAGYALTVGEDVFLTERAALEEMCKRADAHVADYERYITAAREKRERIEIALSKATT